MSSPVAKKMKMTKDAHLQHSNGFSDDEEVGIRPMEVLDKSIEQANGLLCTSTYKLRLNKSRRI